MKETHRDLDIALRNAKLQRLQHLLTSGGITLAVALPLVGMYAYSWMLCLAIADWLCD